MPSRCSVRAIVLRSRSHRARGARGAAESARAIVIYNPDLDPERTSAERIVHVACELVSA